MIKVHLIRLLRSHRPLKGRAKKFKIYFNEHNTDRLVIPCRSGIVVYILGMEEVAQTIGQ